MERHRGDAGTKHAYSMSAIIRGKGNSHECGKNITTISLSQKTKGSLLALAWRGIALLRTISLSQKTKGSLLALAWRELTTSREERLSLLRLSRGAKEEDESQIALLRTISLSQKTKGSLLALPVLLYIHNDSYQIYITICK